MVAVVAALLLVAVPTGAAPDRLSVEAGWSGRFRPGRTMPVRVTVPDGGDGAAVEVVVRSGTGAVTTTTAQVGEGRTVTALGVTAPDDLDRLVVRARLRRHGSTEAAGRTTITAVGDAELVGVLPGLARAPRPRGPFPLAVAVGSASLVDLDLGVVGRPGVLGPLATVAATGADIDRLAPAARLALWAWVAGGGRLLIDAAQAPGALPLAWRPATAGARAPAGLGEVRVTGGLLAAGGWRTVLEPTPAHRPTDPDLVATSLAAGGPVASSLTVDAGLRVPAFAVLAGSLVAYIVLAGPAVFIGLRWRRRPELAWVVVPGLAVVVAMGAWIAGTRLGEGERTAVARWSLLSPGATVNGATVGVLSRRGGVQELALPAGWLASAAGGERFDDPGVDVRTDGREAAVTLVGGQFGVLEAGGPTPPSDRLAVRADAAADDDPGTVTGTVANTGPAALEQVVVFLGPRAVAVGDLPAGGSRRWRIDVGAPAGPGDAFTLIEARVWPEAFARATSGRVATEGTGPVNLALWGAALEAAGPNLRAPGSVVAAGWTGPLAGPLPVGEGAGGRTVVMARSPVPAAGRLSGWDVRRDLLRGPATTPMRSRGGEPLDGAVVRFTLPPSAVGRAEADSRFELVVPAAVDRVDGWEGARWGPLRVGPSSADPSAPARVVSLPATAQRGGVVHVRIGVRRDAVPAAAAGLLLRSRG